MKNLIYIHIYVCHTEAENPDNLVCHSVATVVTMCILVYFSAYSPSELVLVLSRDWSS